MEHQEFIIHYQPIVELESRRIIGFEALVRWQHPTRGLVRPQSLFQSPKKHGAHCSDRSMGSH